MLFCVFFVLVVPDEFANVSCTIHVHRMLILSASVSVQLAASGRPTQAHQAQIETGSVILITPPSAKPPSNYNPHYYVYLN